METEADSRTAYMWRVCVTVSIVIAALAAVGALTVLTTGLLMLFAAVLAGVFLNQLSRLVARVTGLAYGAALATVVFTLLLLMAMITYFMGSRINYQAAEFSEQFVEASKGLQGRLEQLGWWQWLEGGNSEEFKPLSPSNVLSTAKSAFLVTVSAIGGAVLVAFLGFYFALQPQLYREGLVRLLPVSFRPRTEELMQGIAKTLWWWLLGRLLGMAIIGVGSAIGLWLLGIPLPITLGVIAAMANFVPNLGPLIASVPPMHFGLQQGPGTAMYVAAFYLVLQFVESYFITPLIDQQQINLPPGLTLAAQLLLGMTAGFLGLLLATPLTAVTFILVRELYVHDFLERPKCRLPSDRQL